VIIRKSLRGVSPVISVVALSVSSSLALAQDDDTIVDTVVVTGSSIRGVAGVGSPVVGIDRDAFAATGKSTSTELLRALPQVINLGADEGRLSGAQDAAANETRVNGVNLRGLGPEATLLLVNGRRISPSGVTKAIADPSILPTAAIERVEVVLDGASAIYGADAVAGVVNLITRRRFDGAESLVRYGAGDDIDQKLFSQTFGRTWQGGSVFAAYEYNSRSRLKASDRDFTSSDLRPVGGADLRSTLASPGNIVVGNTRYALPDLTPGAPNLFDEGTNQDLLPEQKRHSAFVTLSQDITDSVEVYLDGLWSSRKFDVRVVPASARATVPNTNPFFVSPVPGATSASVEYRFVREDANARHYGDEETWQAVLGTKISLGRDWELDAFVSRSSFTGFMHRGGLVNPTGLAAAVADTNPATSLNLFDPTATVSAANLARILAYRDTHGDQDQTDIELKADGPLFELPGGQVRFAIGAGYHEADFRRLVLSTLISPVNQPVPEGLTDKLGRDSKHVFGELFIPLVGSGNAVPMVDRLELSLAARYEDYSDFGDTSTPKVAVIWSPIEDLTLRGSYGKSFRAPSLIDIRPGQTIFIGDIIDPTSPTGVTRGIYTRGSTGKLAPEKAKTWTLGLDWTPTFAPGLKTSLGYYSIEYTDRIDIVPSNLLANEALYARFIVRNPSPELVEYYYNLPGFQSTREPVSEIRVITEQTRSNLGSLHQKGVDLSASYAFDTGIGDWRVGANLQRVLETELAAVAGGQFVDVLGNLNYPVELRGRFDVQWRNGNWSAALFANYADGFDNTAVNPVAKIGSMTTFDGSISFASSAESGSPLSGLRVTLSMQNITDKEPRTVINGNRFWDSQSDSPIGRFTSLEISKSW
jgi:iron complex outermembrane receptor protein